MFSQDASPVSFFKNYSTYVPHLAQIREGEIRGRGEESDRQIYRDKGEGRKGRQRDKQEKGEMEDGRSDLWREK